MLLHVFCYAGARKAFLCFIFAVIHGIFMFCEFSLIFHINLYNDHCEIITASNKTQNISATCSFHASILYYIKLTIIILIRFAEFVVGCKKSHEALGNSSIVTVF